MTEMTSQDPLSGGRRQVELASQSPSGRGALRLVELQKHFQRQGGDQVIAVDGVSLTIERGEMVVILGPSGCGKTTLLRCIAGLEEPTGGEIYGGERLISSGSGGIIDPPERRGFGMMFQSYAVWPHMTAFGNVAYPLKVRGIAKKEIEERVDRVLHLVGIGHLRDEYSAQLSGGQQQRIALARCLVADPEIILFDEPLSNVDAKVREDLRIELLTMQRRIGFAGVYVTHDQEEAMSIADRIVVMKDGVVEQLAPPREVYGRPMTRFVAGFIGVINEYEGVVERQEGDLIVVSTSIGEVRASAQKSPSDLQPGDGVVVLMRPEAVSVSTEDPSDSLPHDANLWSGPMFASMFHGAHTDYFVDLGEATMRARAAFGAEVEEGAEVFAVVPAKQVRILPLDGDAKSPRDV